jgi:hypothetical protein
LADKLIQLKRTKSKWEVINFIVESWAKTNPRSWRSHIVNLQSIKQSRKLTTVGTKQFSGVSKDKATGGYLRYALDIPEKVIFIIRKLYTAEELPMDKEFFSQFGKRFPIFVISERK